LNILSKGQFSVKNETKIALGFFRFEDRTSNVVDVKIKECRLSFFFIFFLILFFFQVIFHFSIFRTLGLGLEVISHTVTSVTTDGVVTILIIGLKKRK